jgi:hypothetical protein
MFQKLYDIFVFLSEEIKLIFMSYNNNFYINYFKTFYQYQQVCIHNNAGCKGLDLAKCAVLEHRKNFNIDSVELKKSNIPEAGRGVFAIKNIKAGEIITFYPADYICYKYKTGEYVILTSEIAHNAGYNDIDCNFEYCLSVDNNYSIIGDPRIYNDNRYIGHLINDGYLPSKIDTSVEYYLNSSKKSNCCFYSINGLQMAIIATKDINIGEELYISYGHKYW